MSNTILSSHPGINLYDDYSALVFRLENKLLKTRHSEHNSFPWQLIQSLYNTSNDSIDCLLGKWTSSEEEIVRFNFRWQTYFQEVCWTWPFQFARLENSNGKTEIVSDIRISSGQIQIGFSFSLKVFWNTVNTGITFIRFDTSIKLYNEEDTSFWYEILFWYGIDRKMVMSGRGVCLHMFYAILLWKSEHYFRKKNWRISYIFLKI